MAILGRHEFRGTQYYVHLTEYTDGNEAIVLCPFEDLMQTPDSITLTVNFPEFAQKGLVFIKDYSENEGVLDFLVKNEIVSEPCGYVSSGFVDIPVCSLLKR